MEPVYLDHNATTPCEPRVVQAMLPWFTERFGNAASRIHRWGEEARAASEEARAQVATAIGAGPKEIVFTSGATESDNLALLGACARLGPAGRRHVVVSAIEHKAVLDPVEHLGRQGFRVTVVPVDAAGLVDPDAVAAAMADDTAIVSVMMANNEVGTVQPVRAIAAHCRERGVLFHTDAAQALGQIPVDVRDLGVDLMSLSAHKLYGPKGVGALFVRRGGRPRVRLEPIVFGGGHERGLRSGTLPVPLLVGFGVAAELAAAALTDGTTKRIAALRDRLREGLLALGGVQLNGHPSERLPGNLNLSFEGVEAQALMLSVARQVACSSGSACSSATLEPSHVLRAMGVDPELAHASLRFGVGRGTTAEQIDAVVHLLHRKVPELRALSHLAFETTLRGGSSS